MADVEPHSCANSLIQPIHLARDTVAARNLPTHSIIKEPVIFEITREINIQALLMMKCIEYKFCPLPDN